jgi:hypothetical protein
VRRQYACARLRFERPFQPLAGRQIEVVRGLVQPAASASARKPPDSRYSWIRSAYSAALAGSDNRCSRSRLRARTPAGSPLLRSSRSNSVSPRPAAASCSAIAMVKPWRRTIRPRVGSRPPAISRSHAANGVALGDAFTVLHPLPRLTRDLPDRRPCRPSHARDRFQPAQRRQRGLSPRADRP